MTLNNKKEVVIECLFLCSATLNQMKKENQGEAKFMGSC